MRVLIFAFLAITASALHNDYYTTSYSSYPSYGYGSALYGASYGSGLGYGSGYGYGSGLGYGTGITYGLGSGYGSGISYGVGGGHSHYTTAYKPAVYQTARYSGKQQYGIGAYETGAYGSGAYDTGAYGTDAYGAGAYGTSAYGAGANRAQVSRSRYTSGAAPGKISFTLGGSGYQTGTIGSGSGYGSEGSGYGSAGSGYGSAGSGYGNVKSSAVSKPYGTYRKSVSSVRPSGSPYVGGGAPGKISFTQDFSRVSGQSLGTQRPSGISGVSTAGRTETSGVRDEYPTTDNNGSSLDSDTYDAGEVSGINYEEIEGIGDRETGTGYSDDEDEEISSPVSSPASRTTSESYGQSGNTRSSGFSGSTGTQPRISFTQDFSQVRGQSQYGSKPREQSFNTVSRPLGGINRVSAPAVGTVAQHTVGHDADHLEETDIQGVTDFDGHQGGDVSHGTSDISRHSGYQGVNIKPASVSSFDKLSTGGQSTLSRQSSGSGYGSGVRGGSQSFSAGPAKISFVQDFSRISGHQTSGIKPVISSRNRIPATVTAPVAPKPVADKFIFKAPKTPVVQQPTYTTVYDDSPVQGISDGAAGQITSDKYTHFAEPINTGFVREHAGNYKQEIVNVADYDDDVLNAPRSGAAYDKSSSYSQSGLSGGSFGNVGSVFKFTSAPRVGVIPTGGFAEEKRPVYELTSGRINSGLSSIAGQGQVGYSAITTPFKSYYSSSYPGYSHVSGESPRFDFAHDRSLLYYYNSPSISSPFSYAYSSGKGQYGDIYQKAAA